MASTGESVIWHFTHLGSKTEKIVVIGLESAKALVALISSDDLPHWNVRKDDSTSAVPLGVCSDLFEKVDRTVVTGPIKLEGNVTGFKPVTGNRRKHARYTAKLSVTLIKGSEVFSALTKDVSMGGMLIRNALPKHFLNSNCKIIICSIDNSLNVQFDAKILSISNTGSRIQFEEMSEENFRSFQKWMDKQKPDPVVLPTKKFARAR